MVNVMVDFWIPKNMRHFLVGDWEEEGDVQWYGFDKEEIGEELMLEQREKVRREQDRDEHYRQQGFPPLACQMEESSKTEEEIEQQIEVETRDGLQKLEILRRERGEKKKNELCFREKAKGVRGPGRPKGRGRGRKKREADPSYNLPKSAFQYLRPIIPPPGVRLFMTHNNPRKRTNNYSFGYNPNFTVYPLSGYVRMTGVQDVSKITEGFRFFSSVTRIPLQYVGCHYRVKNSTNCGDFMCQGVPMILDSFMDMKKDEKKLGIQVRPKVFQFPCVTIKFDGINGCVNIFDSGSYVMLGQQSREDVTACYQKLCRITPLYWKTQEQDTQCVWTAASSSNNSLDLDGGRFEDAETEEDLPAQEDQQQQQQDWEEESSEGEVILYESGLPEDPGVWDLRTGKKREEQGGEKEEGESESKRRKTETQEGQEGGEREVGDLNPSNVTSSEPSTAALLRQAALNMERRDRRLQLQRQQAVEEDQQHQHLQWQQQQQQVMQQMLQQQQQQLQQLPTAFQDHFRVCCTPEQLQYMSVKQEIHPQDFVKTELSDEEPDLIQSITTEERESLSQPQDFPEPFIEAGESSINPSSETSNRTEEITKEEGPMTREWH